MTIDPIDFQALRNRLKKLEKQNRTLKLFALSFGVILLGTVLVVVSPVTVPAQDNQPVFYFGGKRLFVGMLKSEAVASLSGCCKLYPPAEMEIEQPDIDAGQMRGYTILPKDDSQPRILGGIFFVGGRVVSITRPLSADDYDSWSDDVVVFARTLCRTIAPVKSDSESTVLISVRHERESNAGTDFVSLSFQNGRGVRFSVVSLDKPMANAPPELRDKRDSVTLEEFLEPPRRR